MTLPDKLVQDVVVTLTSCDMWSLISWDSMSISSEIIHRWNCRQHDECDEIYFKQVMHRTFIDTIGLGATVKTTIDPDKPAIVQEVPFDCKILGDDQIHHFGYYNDIEPPTINVSCNKKLSQATE